MTEILRIGTRGSQLALWQANWVRSKLIESRPSLSIELVTIRTKGDKILDAPLARVGGKGLFVKEIEDALLDDRIDLAVHSMKDMPALIPDGLCIGCVPERESPYDVLISKENLKFSALKKGARIGTSSLRRSAQLLYARPDLEIVPLRGNLDTRIRKLESREMDAIVLAAAGIRRLELENRISEYLTEDLMLPAVGQGALCVEIRDKDSRTAALLAALEDPASRMAVAGERAFLKHLEGSCQVPIAAYGKISGEEYTLHGLVADLSGSRIVRDKAAGALVSAENIGIELAERLLSSGARQILSDLKKDMAENEKR